MKLKLRRKLTEAIQVNGAEYINTDRGYDLFDIKTWNAAQQFKIEDTNDSAGAFVQNEATFTEHINQNQHLYFLVRQNTNKVALAVVKGNEVNSGSIQIKPNNYIPEVTITLSCNFGVETRPGQTDVLNDDSKPLYLIPGANITADKPEFANIYTITGRNVIPDGYFEYVDDEGEIFYIKENSPEAEQYRSQEQTNNNNENQNAEEEEHNEEPEVQNADQIAAQNFKNYYVDRAYWTTEREYGRTPDTLYNRVQVSSGVRSEAREILEEYNKLSNNAKNIVNTLIRSDFNELMTKAEEGILKYEYNNDFSDSFSYKINLLYDRLMDDDSNMNFLNEIDSEANRYWTSLDQLTQFIDNISSEMSSIEQKPYYRKFETSLTTLKNKVNEMKTKYAEIKRSYLENRDSFLANNFRYKIEGKEVTILGLKKRITSNANIIIPEKIEGKPVTKIGSYAFFNLGDSIYKLKVPNTLKLIERGAFYKTNIISTVTLPRNCHIGKDNMSSGTSFRYSI